MFNSTLIDINPTGYRVIAFQSKISQVGLIIEVTCNNASSYGDEMPCLLTEFFVNQLGVVAREPVLGVFDQARINPVCSVAGT